MRRQNAKRLLTSIAESKAEIELQWEKLCEVLGCEPESPLHNAIWRQFTLLLAAASLLLGDPLVTLEWFYWDNDGGDCELEHSLPNGEMRAVKTIDDLLDVLGIGEDAE
jgi:hypothetical protein